MATLTIDNKTYDIERLPDEAKAQVTSLQFVERELQQLHATLAVFQTARNAYISALMPHLVALDAQAVKPLHH